MAERVGFEPTCPLRDKTLSRRPRYDHFGTSPTRCPADADGPPVRMFTASVTPGTGHYTLPARPGPQLARRSACTKLGDTLPYGLTCRACVILREARPTRTPTLPHVLPERTAGSDR